MDETKLAKSYGLLPAWPAGSAPLLSLPSTALSTSTSIEMDPFQGLQNTNRAK